MGNYKNILILTLLVIAGFLVYGYLKSRPALPDLQQQTPPGQNEQTIGNKPDASNNFETKSNEGGGLAIEVTPINFKPDEPLQFEVKFTTHQGDLNFDLLKQAVLIDDKNKTYAPLSWDGGTGGHHISGTLIFPGINSDAKRMKLTIKDVYDIPERIFEWDLK